MKEISKMFLILLALMIVFSSLSAFAAVAPANVNFDKGMPDALTTLYTDGAGYEKINTQTNVYKIVKQSVPSEKTGVTKTFSAIESGNATIDIAFEAKDCERAYISLGYGDDASPALNFTIHDGSLCFISDGAEQVLYSDIDDSTSYTLSLTINEIASGFVTSAYVDNAFAASSLKFDNGSTYKINELSAYVEGDGSSVIIHRFSVNSPNVYFWEDFSDASLNEKWLPVKADGDISEIVKGDKPSYLSMVISKPGDTAAGAGISFSPPGTGKFKLTMKFSVSGNCTKTLRFTHTKGGAWLSTLNFGNQGAVAYGINTTSFANLMNDLKPDVIHTLTYMISEDGKHADIAIDGENVAESTNIISPGANQLGYILFHIDSGKTGAFNLYSIDVEEGVTRTVNIKSSSINGLTEGRLESNFAEGSYNLTNDTSAPLDVTQIMMWFDGNMMKKISAKQHRLPVGIPVEIKCDIEGTKTGDSSVYMFLWDNINDIKPYADLPTILSEKTE